MDDFDGNGIFSARWETSFWTPGDYQVEVDLQGKFGEVDIKGGPFPFAEKRLEADMSVAWQEIAKFGKKVVASGLTSSRFGNISLCQGEKISITCTGSHAGRAGSDPMWWKWI